MRRVSAHQTCSLEDLYPSLVPGRLLQEDSSELPPVFKEFWPLASAQHFQLGKP